MKRFFRCDRGEQIYLFITLLLVTCQTPQKIVEVPQKVDMKPIIQEVEKSPELKTNPKLQNRISTALIDCQKVSDQTRENYLSCISNSNKQQELIEKQRSQITDLENELWTYRKWKYGIIAIFVIMIIGFLIKLFLPVIIGLIKRSAGIP